ncbi:MAG: hypothetical protein FVQ80_02440 [Planctomycetes bacterium]|nr:hypothetical protein [Planctomycetota bacterium]
MKISVIDCYTLAWKSFSKWWIPLCLISGILVIFQILPRILVRQEVRQLRTSVSSFIKASSENDKDKLEEISQEAATQTAAMAQKLTRLGVYLFPIACLFTVILLMYANWAVKNSKDTKRPFYSLIYIALVHVILAFGKLFAFFLFFFPGVYIYIKLLFVSLIMLEGKKSATAAINISWQITRGNFWKLLLLVIMNTTLQLIAMPTIIGAIPVTGFANTARAAAFRRIWEKSNYAENQENSSDTNKENTP